MATDPKSNTTSNNQPTQQQGPAARPDAPQPDDKQVFPVLSPLTSSSSAPKQQPSDPNNALVPMHFGGMGDSATTPVMPKRTDTTPVSMYDDKGKFIPSGMTRDKTTGKFVPSDFTKKANLLSQIEQYKELQNKDPFFQHATEDEYRNLALDQYMQQFQFQQLQDLQGEPDSLLQTKEFEKMMRMASGQGVYGEGYFKTALKNIWNTVGGGLIRAGNSALESMDESFRFPYADYYSKLNDAEVEAVKKRVHYENIYNASLDNIHDLVNQGVLTEDQADDYINAVKVSNYGMDFIEKLKTGSHGITSMAGLLQYMKDNNINPNSASKAPSATPWKAYLDNKARLDSELRADDFISKHLEGNVNPLWNILKEYDRKDYLANDAQATKDIVKWRDSFNSITNILGGGDDKRSLFEAIGDAASSGYSLLQHEGLGPLIDTLKDPNAVGGAVGTVAKYGLAHIAKEYTGINATALVAGTDAVQDAREARLNAYHQLVSASEDALITPEKQAELEHKGILVGLGSYLMNYAGAHYIERFGPKFGNMFDKYAKSNVVYKSFLGSIGSLTFSGVKTAGLVISGDVLSTEQGLLTHQMAGQKYTIEDAFNDFSNATGTSLALGMTFGFIPTTKKLVRLSNMARLGVQGFYTPHFRSNIKDLTVNGSAPYTPSNNIDNMYGVNISGGEFKTKVTALYDSLMPKVRGIADLLRNRYSLNNIIKKIDKNGHAESSMAAMLKISKAWVDRLGSFTSGDKVSIALAGAEHILKGVYQTHQEVQDALEKAQADPKADPDLLAKLADELRLSNIRTNGLLKTYKSIKDLSEETKALELPSFTKEGDRSLLGLRDRDIRDNYKTAYKLVAENEDADLTSEEMRTRPEVNEARLTEEPFNTYDKATAFMTNFDEKPNEVRANDIARALESNRLSKGEKIRLARELVYRLDSGLQNNLFKLKASRAGREALTKIRRAMKLSNRGKHKEAQAILSSLAKETATNSDAIERKLKLSNVIETSYERLPHGFRTRQGETVAELKHQTEQNHLIADTIRRLNNPDHEKSKKENEATLKQPLRKGLIDKVVNTGYNTLTRTHIKGYWKLNDSEIDEVLRQREIDHDKLDVFRKVHNMNHTPIDSKLSYKRDKIFRIIKANKPINGKTLTRGEQIYLMNERHLESNAYLNRILSSKLSGKAKAAIESLNPMTVDWASVMKNAFRPKTAFKIITGRYYRENLKAVADTVFKYVKAGEFPSTKTLKEAGFSKPEIIKIQNRVAQYFSDKDEKGNPIKSKKGTSIITGSMIPDIEVPYPFMKGQKPWYLETAKELFANILNGGVWDDTSRRYFRDEDEFRTFIERFQEKANRYDPEAEAKKKAEGKKDDKKGGKKGDEPKKPPEDGTGGKPEEPTPPPPPPPSKPEEPYTLEPRVGEDDFEDEDEEEESLDKIYDPRQGVFDFDEPEEQGIPPIRPLSKAEIEAEKRARKKEPKITKAIEDKEQIVDVPPKQVVVSTTPRSETLGSGDGGDRDQPPQDQGMPPESELLPNREAYIPGKFNKTVHKLSNGRQRIIYEYFDNDGKVHPYISFNVGGAGQLLNIISNNTKDQSLPKAIRNNIPADIKKVLDIQKKRDARANASQPLSIQDAKKASLARAAQKKAEEDARKQAEEEARLKAEAEAKAKAKAEEKAKQKEEASKKIEPAKGDGNFSEKEVSKFLNIKDDDNVDVSLNYPKSIFNKGKALFDAGIPHKDLSQEDQNKVIAYKLYTKLAEKIKRTKQDLIDKGKSDTLSQSDVDDITKSFNEINNIIDSINKEKDPKPEDIIEKSPDDLKYLNDSDIENGLEYTSTEPQFSNLIKIPKDLELTKDVQDTLNDILRPINRNITLASDGTIAPSTLKFVYSKIDELNKAALDEYEKQNPDYERQEQADEVTGKTEPEEAKDDEEVSTDQDQEPTDKPDGEDKEEDGEALEDDEEQLEDEDEDEIQADDEEDEDQHQADLFDDTQVEEKRLQKTKRKIGKSYKKKRDEERRLYEQKVAKNKELQAQRDELDESAKAMHIDFEVNKEELHEIQTLKNRGNGDTQKLIHSAVFQLENYIDNIDPNVRRSGTLPDYLLKAINDLSVAMPNSDLVHSHLVNLYTSLAYLREKLNSGVANKDSDEFKHLTRLVQSYASILGRDSEDVFSSWLGDSFEFPTDKTEINKLPITTTELEDLSNIGKAIIDKFNSPDYNYEDDQTSLADNNLSPAYLLHHTALMPLLQGLKNSSKGSLDQKLATMNLLDYIAHNPILFSKVDIEALLPKLDRKLEIMGLPVYRHLGNTLTSIYKRTKKFIEEKELNLLPEYNLSTRELLNDSNERVLVDSILKPQQRVAYSVERSRESTYDEFVPSFLNKDGLGISPLLLARPQYQFKDVKDFRDFTTSIKGKSIFDSSAYLAMVQAIVTGKFDSEILGTGKAYMHQKAKELHDYIQHLNTDVNYKKGNIGSQKVLEISDHLIKNFAGYLYSDAILNKFNDRVKNNVASRLLDMGARMADVSSPDRYAVAQLSRDAYHHESDPQNRGAGGELRSEYPVAERLEEMGVHPDTEGLVNFYKDMQLGLENLVFRADRKDINYQRRLKEYNEIKTARDNGEVHPLDKGGKLVEPVSNGRDQLLYNTAMQGWRNILPDLQTNSQGISKDALFNPPHMRNNMDRVAMDPKHANDLIAHTTSSTAQQKILDHAFSKTPQEMGENGTLDGLNKAESNRADSLAKLRSHIQMAKQGKIKMTQGAIDNIKHFLGEALHQNPLLRQGRNYEKLVGRNKGNAVYQEIYQHGMQQIKELNTREAKDEFVKQLGDNSIQRRDTDGRDFEEELQNYREYYEQDTSDPHLYTDYEGETLYNKVLSTKATKGKEVGSTDKHNYIGEYFKEGNNNNFFTMTKIGRDARFLGTDLMDYLTDNPTAMFNRQALVKAIWKGRDYKHGKVLHALDQLVYNHNPKFLTSLNRITANLLENIRRNGLIEGTNESIVNSLIHADGKMDQHVAMILSSSAFDWYSINGFESANPTEETFERFVGDGSAITQQKISDVTDGHVTHQDDVINFMGRMAMNLLNLKGKDNAPEYVEDNLANGLGQIIYASMLDSGQLSAKIVTARAIKEAMNGVLPKEWAMYADDLDKPVTLVKATTDNTLYKNLFGGEGSDFRNKGESQVIRKLANMFENREVQRAPVKSISQKKRSNFKNSPPTMKNVNESNKQPFKIRTSTFALFHILGKGVAQEVYYDGLVPKNVTFDSLKESNRGQWLNKLRQYENMSNFIDEITNVEEDSFGNQIKNVPDIDIFHSKVGWSNDRWGYELSPLNPQQDKLNRHTQAMRAWEYTIKNVADVANGVGSEKELFAHKFLQLAMAEHIFNLTPDKRFEDAVLEDFETRLQNPVIQAGIQALRKVAAVAEKGDYNSLLVRSEDHHAIVEAVKAAGHNTSSFTGLYEYAKYLNNLESNSDHNFDLARYADGINNGAYITMQQAFFGGNDKYVQNIDKLHSFGVSNKEGYTYAGNIMQNPLADNYRNFGKNWGDFLKGVINNITDSGKLDRFNKIESLIGDLSTDSGRESSKYSFLKMIYSAGSHSIIRDLANEQLENIYHHISGKINNELTHDNADGIRQEIETKINNFLDIVGAPNIELTNVSSAKALDSFIFREKGSKDKFNSLSKLNLIKHSKEFQEAVAEVYENPLRRTMTTEYKNFSDYKDTLNSANTIMGSSYNAMYKAEEDRAYARARKNNRDYLTLGERRAIEAKLKPHLPAIYSPESVYQGLLNMQRQLQIYVKKVNDLVNAKKLTKAQADVVIKNYKGKLAQQYKKALESSKVEFNRFQPMVPAKPNRHQITTLNLSKPIKTANGTIISSLSNVAYQRRLVVGAGAVALSTHALEAAAAMAMTATNPGVNVHDGTGFGVNHFEDAPKDVSKALYQITGVFDTVTQFSNSMEKILHAMLSDPEAIKNFRNELDTGYRKAEEKKIQLQRQDTLSYLSEGEGDSNGDNPADTTDIKDPADVYGNIPVKASVLEKPSDALFKAIIKLTGNRTTKDKTWNSLYKGIDTSTGAKVSDEDFKNNIIKELSRFNGQARQIAHYKNESLNELKIYDAYSNGSDSAYKIDQDAIKQVDDLRALRREVDTLNKERTVFDDTRKDTYTPSFIGARFLGSSEEAIKEFTKTSWEKDQKVAFDSTITNDNMKDKFLELLENTPTLSEAHAEHLGKVVTMISENVLDPIKLFMGQGKGASALGLTTEGKILLLREDPTQASKLTATNAMTSPEVYTHELIHRLTKDAIESNGYLRNELSKLWELSKSKIKPEDMLPEGLKRTDPTYSEELRLATANWNHIFQVRAGSLEHLHEFMAISNSNEKFKKLLDKIEMPDIFAESAEDKNLSVRGSLFNLLVKILQFIRELFTKVGGKNVGERSRSLLEYAGRVHRNMHQAVLNSKDGEHGLKDFGKYVTENSAYKKVEDKFNEPWGKAVKYAEEKAEKFYDHTLKSNNFVAKKISEVLSEMRGRTAYNTKILDIKNKMATEIFGEAARNAQNIADDISSKFKEHIAPEQDAALKSVLLKANLHNLDDLAKTLNIPIDKIELIKSPKARQDLIKTIENQLKGVRLGDKDFTNDKIPSLNANELIRIKAHSYNLGRFMATGNNMLMNAMLSGKLINDHEINRMSNNDARVTLLNSNGYHDRQNLINGLITLHALNFTKGDDLNNFSAMYEKNEENKYAIDYAMHYVKDHVQQQQKEYASALYELHDGYTNDITQSRATTAIIDPTNRDDVAYYTARGYEQAYAISQGSHPAVVMVNHLGDTGPYIRGALKFNPKHKPLSGTLNLGESPSEIQQTISNFSNLEAAQLGNKNYMAKEPFSMPIPIRDGATGKIINYRYVMSHAIKDKVLGTDKSFIKTFAKQVSSLPMERLQRDANSNILEAIREVQDEQLSRNSDLFTHISPTNKDKNIQEIWNKMPSEMKEMIESKFGSQGMYVRKDMVNMLFGYHQADIRNQIFVPPEHQGAVAKMLISILTPFCKDDPAKAIRFIVRSNDFIKELVSWAKNAIIIKSGVVTLLNLIGNWHQLTLSGLGPIQAIRYYSEAYTALNEYDKLKADLVRAKALEASPHLRRDSDAHLDSVENIQNRIEQTQIHKMSQHGIDPTMTEFSGSDKKQYELENLRKRFIQSDFYKSSVEKVFTPEQIEWAKSNIFMSRGTAGYREMQHKAEFAEFGAKYARFKFLTEEMKFDHDKAARHTIDEFVDYDIPQSKMLNAMESYGLLWFSKYKLRLQKVLWNMFKRNPTRIMTGVLLNSMYQSVFGGTVLGHTESPYHMNMITNSIHHNIHNPFSMVGYGVKHATPVVSLANAFLKS